MSHNTLLDGDDINVFYTGLPPYHSLATAEKWEPKVVDKGVRNDTIKLVQAGYNVHVVAAGPEVSKSLLSQKLKEKEVQWHFIGIGMGVRAAKTPHVIHYLEDLVHLFHQEAPQARIVFNSGPGSCLESIQYRLDGRSARARQGKLLGYEELFEGQHGEPLESVPQRQ